MKKVLKIFSLLGCIGYAGFGATFVHYGLKIIKWAFENFENEL